MRPDAFRIERFFAEYEFRAPYLLCASDLESMTVGELLALEPGAADRLDGLWLGYTESTGSPALREAIAGVYETISPEDVLVHVGAEEAIFAFMNAVLAPGDHVIAHAPAYASLHEVARSIGCEVTPWPAEEAEGWALDVDFVARSIRPTTKVVVVNCPHNPTGYLMPRDDFRALLELADRHGVIVFSDEVYRFLEYDEADRLPAACDASELAVSLGVVSKSLGLAGLRVGWVATRNRAVLRAMAEIKDYLSICGSAPSEFLAELALRHRDVLLRRNLAIVLGNLEMLDAFFGRHRDRFSWRRPKAGPVAFPAYLGPEGSDRFCAELRDRAGVLLLPGSLFDHGNRHFRLGFGRRDLAAGLERLEEHLRGVRPPA